MKNKEDNWELIPDPEDVNVDEEDNCIHCAGYGVVKGELCWGCGGSGKDIDTKEDE